MSVRDMSDVTRIQYLRSDITVSTQVYEAATHIFSGFVAAKAVNSDNKSEMMELAVTMALELALTTEKIMAKTGNKTPGL